MGQLIRYLEHESCRELQFNEIKIPLRLVDAAKGLFGMRLATVIQNLANKYFVEKGSSTGNAPFFLSRPLTNTDGRFFLIHTNGLSLSLSNTNTYTLSRPENLKFWMQKKAFEKVS